MRRELGFGMMRLPLTEAGKPALIDVERTKDMVDQFLDDGYSYFDTAFGYHDGSSESVVKKVLVDRYPRDAFQLATKLPVWLMETRDDMQRIYREQYDKCGVEYFDRYLIHNVNGDTVRKADALDAWSFLISEKEKGKLRSIGFSYHDDADLLKKILKAHPEMDFVQLQLNYADWEDPAIQSRRCYEAAREAGKDIIVMEPVKGGLLAHLPETAQSILGTEESGAQAALALRFVANLEGVILTLSGMSSVLEVVQNCNLFQDMKKLDKTEEDLLPQLARSIRSNVKVQCTGCNYCNGCPVQIPIPRYFALWNDRPENQEGFSSQQMYYDNAVAQGFGRAEDCIACHTCETHCPQQIPIVEKMEAVSAVFDRKNLAQAPEFIHEVKPGLHYTDCNCRMRS